MGPKGPNISDTVHWVKVKVGCSPRAAGSRLGLRCLGAMLTRYFLLSGFAYDVGVS